MRVLTVRQPWASEIIAGTKRIENRSWHPQHGGRIAIHAGARGPGDDLASILGTVFVAGWHEAGDRFGGFCPELGCREHGGMQFSEYAAATGREPFELRRLWHWELTSPREFVTPIPRVRGALGLWTPTPGVAHLIEIAEVRR